MGGTTSPSQLLVLKSMEFLVAVIAALTELDRLLKRMGAITARFQAAVWKIRIFMSYILFNTDELTELTTQ